MKRRVYLTSCWLLLPLLAALSSVPTCVSAQDVPARIKHIRALYQSITAGRDQYQAREKDITWDAFDFEEEEDRTLRKYVKFFYDTKSLKLAVVTTEVINDYSHFKEVAEYYFEQGNVLFAHVVSETHGRSSLSADPDNERMWIVEKRVYFNDKGSCIRYLKKDIEGMLLETDELRQDAQNIEESCSDIDVIDVVDELAFIRKYWTNR